jgi:hypothetical protein
MSAPDSRQHWPAARSVAARDDRLSGFG